MRSLSRAVLGYLVAAAACSGQNALTPVDSTGAEPTLTALALTPATVTVQTSHTQMFAPIGVMSDGSTRPLSVTWSATGGTISSAGF